MPRPEPETPTGNAPPAGQSAQEEPRISDPPAALWSRNPLARFRFFGPGAIVASVTVGSGQSLKGLYSESIQSGIFSRRAGSCLFPGRLSLPEQPAQPQTAPATGLVGQDRGVQCKGYSQRQFPFKGH